MLCITPHNFYEIAWLSVVLCLSSPPEHVFLRGQAMCRCSGRICGIAEGDAVESTVGQRESSFLQDYF